MFSDITHALGKIITHWPLIEREVFGSRLDTKNISSSLETQDHLSLVSVDSQSPSNLRIVSATPRDDGVNRKFRPSGLVKNIWINRMQLEQLG